MDLFGGLQGAIAKGAARWAGTAVGMGAFGFLLAHTQVASWLNQACVSLSSEDAMKGFFGTGAVALLTLYLGIKDKTNVNGKVAVAAAAGFDKGQATALQQAMQAGAGEQASADTTKVEAVAEAMKVADTASKQDKTSLVEALKSGTF